MSQQSKMIHIVVSGKCPRCAIVNNAKVRTTGPIGTRCVGRADASCGACGAAIVLSGSAVIE